MLRRTIRLKRSSTDDALHKSHKNQPRTRKTALNRMVKDGLIGIKLLQLNYVFSLRTAVAFNYVELNALAFFKSFEAFANDCGEVYENVVSAFNFDEAETFLSVEPFNCTLLHVELPPKSVLICACFVIKQKIHTLERVS